MKDFFERLQPSGLFCLFQKISKINYENFRLYSCVIKQNLEFLSALLLLFTFSLIVFPYYSKFSNIHFRQFV